MFKNFNEKFTKNFFYFIKKGNLYLKKLIDNSHLEFT